MPSQKPRRIKRFLEAAAKDYERTTGDVFSYFYCPILHVDEHSELCLGHVVNRRLEGSSKKLVLQRADVDNFYGAVFESEFQALFTGKAQSPVEQIGDKGTSTHVRFRIEHNGKDVPYYVVKDHHDPNHPVMLIEEDENKAVEVALKLSEDAPPLTEGRLQLVREHSFVASGTASILKAAHLSMFRVFGYKYVFTPGGQLLAKILRDCFSKHKGDTSTESRECAQEYFAEHTGMIRPMLEYNNHAVTGTVDDKRIVVCMGSSGAPYGIGVFVRTGMLMSIVMLPGDNPATVGSWDYLVRNPEIGFSFKVAQFDPVANDGGGALLVDKKQPMRMEFADESPI